MFNIIFKLRFVSLVAVFFSLLGAVLMLGIGSMEVVEAFEVMLSGETGHEHAKHLEATEVATIQLIEATDAFLFGLVLMMFAFGIFVLFVGRESVHMERIPDWMHPHDIGDLKSKLAEVIIVMIFVRFLKEIVLDSGALTYEHLLLPGCAVLLALALKLMHGGHH